MVRLLLTYGPGWIVAAVLLVAGPSPGAGEPAEARRHFEMGNQHYAQGQYTAAVDAYRAALATGYTSGALYYNLGTAYFRTDELGRSVLYYEKARRLLPDDPKVQHSLEVARTAAGAPPPPARSGWHALAAALPPMPPFVLGLLLLGGALGLIGYRRRIALPPWMGRAVPALLVGGLLLIGAGLGASYVAALDQRAVVVAPEAPVHPSPMAQSPPDTSLTEGTVLHRLRRQPAWTEVRLPSGRSGWVRSAAVADV